ncbi:MAG: polysaccharide deacetylase, partial [Rhodobacterales bacterium]|nr:polysaccharide deacetylase [Rhodobacterales bacterium]
MEDSSPIWPDGVECTVLLTFDFDSETNWISRDRENLKRPGTLSQGSYGAKVGVPKILELLREEDLPATFFVPGWVAENRTRRVEAIVAAGHEVAHHGYLHLWIDPDNPDGEVEELERGLEALKRCVGVVPRGYRSPAGETSANILRLLAERDFLYDSSLMDDVFPYRHVLADGRPGPVELPWHWSLDDAPFVLFAIKSPRPIFTNEHILSIWKKEFAEIHRWGGLFDLVMHPQAIGRPSRLAMLREFIAYTREFPGVRYAT